ncbi:MAG: type II toxin-antitoxin system VapC family toxin [Bryobacterales bacterium]|nr:type II toxin-antitoxin system VapC family toxin [Bryobacterales bacterium]
MKYWDSSALVSLLVEEGQTAARIELLERDPSIVTWWGSRIECASALNRLRREQLIDAAGLNACLERLQAFAASWVEIEALDRVRYRALRLLRFHALRSADAMQLAAALVASGEYPRTLDFVCSDTRLSDAAGREGFTIV